MTLAKLILVNKSKVRRKATGLYNLPLLIRGEIKELCLGRANHSCREIILAHTFIDKNQSITIRTAYNLNAPELSESKLFFDCLTHKSMYQRGELDPTWEILKNKDDRIFFEKLFSVVIFNNSPITLKRINENLKFKVEITDSYSINGFKWKASLALLILRHPVLFMKDLLSLKDEISPLLGSPESLQSNKLKFMETMLTSALTRCINTGRFDVDGYSSEYGVSPEGMVETSIGLLFGDDFTPNNNSGIASHGESIYSASIYASLLKIPAIHNSPRYLSVVKNLRITH